MARRIDGTPVAVHACVDTTFDAAPGRRLAPFYLVLGPTLTAAGIGGFFAMMWFFETVGSALPRLLVAAPGLAAVGGVIVFYKGLWLLLTGVDVPLRSPPRNAREARLRIPFALGFMLLFLGSLALAVSLAVP
jgi:hypothetical protein